MGGASGAPRLSTINFISKKSQKYVQNIYKIYKNIWIHNTPASYHSTFGSAGTVRQTSQQDGPGSWVNTPKAGTTVTVGGSKSSNRS